MRRIARWALSDGGRGRPLTLFVPGGGGENLVDRMRYLDRITGTKIGFAYAQSGYCEALAPSAATPTATPPQSVLLPASTASPEPSASPEEPAIVGALAESANLFDRVALVIPPEDTRRGRSATWLESHPSVGSGDGSTEVLVVGHRGDHGHPARVAQRGPSSSTPTSSCSPHRGLHRRRAGDEPACRLPQLSDLRGIGAVSR